MPLQGFTFDKKPDIRLVVYGETVYKIKRVVCAILNSDVLMPVQTDSFVVYPSLFDKTHWETSEKVLFSQHGQSLDAHPYSYTLYVEERQTLQSPATNHTERHLSGTEQLNEPTEPAATAAEERIVTEYGQKNRHDVEERDLKEFLRLQQMASEEDENADDSDQCEEPPSGLQRVFNALVSPMRSFLGQ